MVCHPVPPMLAIPVAKMRTMTRLAQTLACLLLAGGLAALSSAHAQTDTDGQATQQDSESVAKLVTTYLEQQAASYPGSAKVSVDASRVTRYSACTDLDARLSRGQKLRSRLSVEVRCHAPEKWTARVQAEVAIEGFFYVTNHTIEPGDTLSLDDVSAREGDILRVARGVVVDPSRLIDQIATQRIPRGVPVKSSSLRSPMSIQRGQNVRTQAQGQGFSITGQGQALQAGDPGEQIRVRTPSGRIITATVINANTVQVNM